MRREDLIRFSHRLSADYVDAGENVLFQCPFAPWKHKSGRDRTPSMSIRVNEYGDSPFHCFGCGASGGNLETMALRLQDYGLDRSAAARLLEFIAEAEENLDELRIDIDDLMQPTEPVRLALPPPSFVMTYDEESYERKFCRLHDTRDVNSFLGYVRKRGLSRDTVAKFGLGYDAVADRLMLPVRWHTGQIVGAIGRLCHDPRPLTDGKKELPYYNYWRFPKSVILFGENLLREETVVVCEGPFDALKVSQAGFNAVAVMGAKFSDAQADKLAEWGQPVVIFFDPDETGFTQARRLTRALHARGIPAQAVFPPAGEDAGSLSDGAIRAILGPLHPDAAVHFPAYWQA